MQQDPIINHGTLIDTYNYNALITSQAQQVSQRIKLSANGDKVIKSRPSRRFKAKTTKSSSKAKTRVLRKNNTQNK